MLPEPFLRTRGFSLIEVLVATVMLTVSVLSLVPLFTMATTSTTDAAHGTEAAVLAQQKLEQLRTLPATDPAAFFASPAAALQQNIVGYVDYLDADGTLLDGSTTKAPRGASFTRRWSIDTLPTDPAGTVIIQVLVAHQRDFAAHKAGAGGSPGAIRLVTLRTRRVR